MSGPRAFHHGPTLSHHRSLAREVISRSEIEKAEADANRIVWEDRPVSDPLSRPPKKPAAMPYAQAIGSAQEHVAVDRCDRSTTCRLVAAHMSSAPARIGIIAIGSVGEVQGRLARSSSSAEGVALQRFKVWRGALAAMQKHLSVPPIDMAATIERMQEDAKAAFSGRFADSRRSSRFIKRTPCLRRGAPVIVEALDRMGRARFEGVRGGRHCCASRMRRSC